MMQIEPDILIWLRHSEMELDRNGWSDANNYRRAADEIERLRAEVTMLRGVMELEPSEVLREQR